MLKVSIKNAKNLPIGDIRTSDPFVLLYGISGAGTYLFDKTFFVPNTLNPDWENYKRGSEEGWVFYVPACLCESLLFEVYDHDYLSTDDFLTKTEIRVHDLKFNEDMTLPLYPSPLPNKKTTLTILVNRYEDVPDPLRDVSLPFAIDTSEFERIIAFLEVPNAKENPILKARVVNESYEVVPEKTVHMTGVVANHHSFTRAYSVKDQKLTSHGDSIEFYLENFSSVVLNEENSAIFFIVGIRRMMVAKQCKTYVGNSAHILAKKPEPRVSIIYSRKLTEKTIPIILSGDSEKIVIRELRNPKLSYLAELEDRIYAIKDGDKEEFLKCMDALNKAIGKIKSQPTNQDINERKRYLAALCLALNEKRPETVSSNLSGNLQRMSIMLNPQ